ncbi:MAG: FAD-dependent monooxygenase [Halobacteriales archaeon]
MTEHEHYEAVVVGCGPGGAAAAASLAANDVETLVLERGVESGSKNVSGGLIYAEESAAYTIDDLFPGFRDEATERPITEYRMHNVAGDRVKSIDLTRLHEHDTEWSDSVLRRRMDSWLEERVHEMTSETGGGVLTGVSVNGLLRDDGEVVGVTCDELEPIEADLVVAADGVNSELARDAGMMDWEEPDEWFQGVKAVVDLPADAVDERFDVDEDEGEAHLFAGDLFDGVRGGGFVYTNDDSLSIGTVFHLDSIVEQEAEPHELLDALLTHPLLDRWIQGDYDEREYGAKLTPDSKKSVHMSPGDGRLVLVGDAGGQMQAMGPLIKGMNHAVTAGGLAGDAFVEAREKDVDPGDVYVDLLRDEGLFGKLRPRRYSLARLGENALITRLQDGFLRSRVGRWTLRRGPVESLMERMMSSPFFLGMLPDTRTPYVTVPTVLAEELGEEVEAEVEFEPKSLLDRIGDLTYDTDVGNPHIEVLDSSFDASGAAVTACPVSARGFGGGCYREETVERNGDVVRSVSLDTQPCVECGTCAIVADTEWRHPSGGRGVEFREG